MTCPAQPAPSAESGQPTTSPSHTPGLEASLTRLVAAIEAQTQAISALAQSNMALVQAMAEAEEQEEEDGPTYLNARRSVR